MSDLNKINPDEPTKATAKKGKRKPFKISLDTQKLDIDLERNENGEAIVKINTPQLKIESEIKEAGYNIIADFKDTDEVEFESNGKGEHLPKGTCWTIAGAMAKVFLQLKLGKIKKVIKKNK